MVFPGRGGKTRRSRSSDQVKVHSQLCFISAYRVEDHRSNRTFALSVPTMWDWKVLALQPATLDCLFPVSTPLSSHPFSLCDGTLYTLTTQVLELVGHILPSALADLALAMASACTAFSDPCAESDSCGDGVASQPVNDSGDQGRRGKKETDRREESTSPTAETWHQGSGRSVGQFLGVSQKTADVKFPEDATRDEQWLFRVVGTVDGETKYLNAGLGAVEAGVAEKSVPADIVTGSYVLETRARFSSSRQGRWLVFDVCSTDPNVIPAVS